MGEGVLDPLDFTFHAGAGFGFVTPGEDVLFDSFDAVESPVIDSEGAGELALDGAVGVEVGDVFLGEVHLRETVFFGYDRGQAGEGACEAVHGGNAFETCRLFLCGWIERIERDARQLRPSLPESAAEWFAQTVPPNRAVRA